MRRLRKLLLAFTLSSISLTASAASVNLNTASADALAEAIDGVGPVKASAIVDYRDTNGPFQRVSDLIEVQGIGDAILEQNRHKLSVKGMQSAQ